MFGHQSDRRLKSATVKGYILINQVCYRRSIENLNKGRNSQHVV
jgi:hypothetical protein